MFNIRENLETAIRLYETAQKILPETNENYVSALIDEISAREILAGTGIGSKVNLETVAHLYGVVQEFFQKRMCSIFLH